MRIAILALFVALQTGIAKGDGFAWPSRENYVGVSRVFNNDFLGDGHDRWHTGSYEVSMTFGDSVANGLPHEAFAFIQYRLRAEIFSPENIRRRRAAPDRPFAGVIGLGAFTHFERGNLNISYGGELNFVGPSTGLGQFQKFIHKQLGQTEPRVLGDQLPDKIYPTLQGEISHGTHFGNAMLRPFVEAQVGLETYARVGMDTIIGRNISRNFFVRDPVTGHLLTNVRSSDERSFGFMMGADVAYVHNSKLLPTSRGYEILNTRPRARIGMVYEAKGASVFYGLTYLGREFERQREGQTVGSLHVKFNF